MADNNRNQDSQFDQSNPGWDQNRRRFDQESDYNRNRENYRSYGNVGSSYGSQQGRRGMSDYDEHRGSFGSQGRSDWRSREMEDQGRYGSASGSSHGQMGGDYGRDYRSTSGMSGGEGHNQDWQRSGYGSQYGQGGDYGREYQGGMGGRSYGEIYHGNLEERERMTNQARGGRQNIMANRDQDRMYGGMRDEDYGRPGRYSDYRSDYGDREYGRMSGGYGDRGRWDRVGDWDRSRERRGFRDTDYDRDRNWWDRTRDEVSSWFGDDDAERRRIMDERRSETYRGRGPRDYHRSDERIREDVCDRLSDDPFIDASDIEVKVEGTEVVLSGTVHNRDEKRRAEDMIESISGVTNVQNKLKVSHDRDSDISSGTTGSTRGM
jgi:osmotically-inducible protein OsmY